MNWRSVVATCVIVLCASSAYAQFDSAQISGVVQDSSGAVLPGVDVTLVNVGTRNERQTVTNEGGLYTFPNVPVGEYRINAMLSGFKPISRSNVQVSAGLNIRVDVSLEVGALTETIQVEAATTLVDTSVIGRTVRAEQIAETPLSGRRASQVAQLAPGVVGGSMGGSVPTGVGTFATGVTSINGGRADEFMTTIDGAPSIRVRAAGGFMMGAQNFDTVAEVQVLTTNYQAEYGRSSAGQLRLVTKSGHRAFVATCSGVTRTTRSTPIRGRASAPASRSRRTSTTRTALRSVVRSTSRARSMRAVSSCSSSGARNGSAIARSRNRSRLCRRQPCGMATSAHCSRARVIRDPADRAAVSRERHPAQSDQPAGAGAAECLSTTDPGIPARRVQLDWQSVGLQQPAEGQHQDRLGADVESPRRRASYVGAQRLERSRANGRVLDDLGLPGPHAGGDADEHALVVADQRVLVLLGLDEPVEVLRAAQL